VLKDKLTRVCHLVRDWEEDKRNRQMGRYGKPFKGKGEK
jgi:hypothetical protein